MPKRPSSTMLDYNELFAESARLISETARNPMPFTMGIGQWLDYCQKVAPTQESLWKRFRTLDFDKDAKKLTKWLERLITSEPIPANINGIWFGLYNPILPTGETSCQMYVGGSCEFDPNSSSDEWVCNLSWLPEGRYSHSQILADLYHSVGSVTADDLFLLGESFLCHGFLAMLVAHWCRGPMRAVLLGDAPIRAIVIGHDSGDFYRMSILRLQ